MFIDILVCFYVLYRQKSVTYCPSCSIHVLTLETLFPLIVPSEVLMSRQTYPVKGLTSRFSNSGSFRTTKDTLSRYYDVHRYQERNF